MGNEIMLNENDISFELDLNLSIQDAWKAWTENEKLESWLTVKSNVEPRLGGSYELFWVPETPQDNSTIGCKITKIQDHELLAFDWKGPVPFADIMNTKPHPTSVEIIFKSIGVNRTAISFKHTGWGHGKKWEDAKNWQKKAWEMAFSNLKKVGTLR